MTISLDGMNRNQLERLQDRVTKQLEKLDVAERKAALAAAQRAAKAYGYDLLELTNKSTRARSAPAKRKSASKPKYANPDNKAQTWSGLGRQPQWFKEAIGSGMKREDLAI